MAGGAEKPYLDDRGGYADPSVHGAKIVSIADVALSDMETSVEGGTLWLTELRRAKRGGAAHDASLGHSCPSCGVALLPRPLRVTKPREPSITSTMSGLFTPGSSVRGGSSHGASRMNALLDLALLAVPDSARSRRSTHAYGAVGDEEAETGIDHDAPPADGAFGAETKAFGGAADLEAAAKLPGFPPAGAAVASPLLPLVLESAEEATKPPPPSRLVQYLAKAKGVPGKRAPPRQTLVEAFVSFLGAFIGLTALGAMDQYLDNALDTLLLVASFGASAVLLYSAPASPLAQPFNVVFGTTLSSLVGVSTRTAFHALHSQATFLAAATAVAGAIFLMAVTGTTHPPGGAMAILAVIGGQKVVEMGFWFIIFPGLVGPLLLMLVAILVNNLSPERSYPQWWLP